MSLPEIGIGIIDACNNFCQSLTRVNLGWALYLAVHMVQYLRISGKSDLGLNYSGVHYFHQKKKKELQHILTDHIKIS